MRFYAIDANGISHWLWHSDRTDRHGNEMSLANATRQWFAEFRERLNPSHVVACFDGGNNWRKAVHVEYKASRAAKPIDEEKLAALRLQPDLWRDLGVEVLRFDTFEADDAIAALCNVHASEDVEVVIVAADKDLMQLVGDHVKQYDPRPNKAGECVFYDAAAVEEKHGVPPHRLAELLAIWGDSSDDVPGVEGWGKVKAINAIRQTKSLPELLRKASAGELKLIDAKHQASLVAQKEALEMSLKLVRLRFDVPVPQDLGAFCLNKEKAA